MNLIVGAVNGGLGVLPQEKNWIFDGDFMHSRSF